MNVKTRSKQKEQELINITSSIAMRMLSEIGGTRLITDGSETQLLNRLDGILDQIGLEISEVLPEKVILDYFGGVDEANAALRAAGETVPTMPAFDKSGMINEPFRRVIHLDAVAALIDDSMLDLTAAIETAKASSRTSITRTLSDIRGQLTAGQITGASNDMLIQSVMNTFLKEGMTSFITSDGKRLPLDFYSMTVARTKTRDATVRGSANRYAETGNDLMMIVGNGDSCKICSAYNEMVVSINGNTPGYPVVGEGVQLPPFHPNCRCGTRPFVLRFKSLAEQEAAQARNEQFDPEKDNRTPTQKAAYEREQAARQKANAEKKQFMKWQAELGADAPKTLDAFRRMKNQDTVKFQQLQTEVRSNAMIRAYAEKASK